MSLPDDRRQFSIRDREIVETVQMRPDFPEGLPEDRHGEEDVETDMGAKSALLRRKRNGAPHLPAVWTESSFDGVFRHRLFRKRDIVDEARDCFPAMQRMTTVGTRMKRVMRAIRDVVLLRSGTTEGSGGARLFLRCS